LIRKHLPESFASKTAALLTERDLKDWRAGLINIGIEGMS